ncbi:MAG: hypothetical protein Q9171_005433 [Xanthocarpia ochracea]
MKERITFIHPPDISSHVEYIEGSRHVIQVKALKAAREERLTVSPHELPQEIWQILKEYHQLHLKWVSEVPYPSVALRPLLQKVFENVKLDAFDEKLCPKHDYECSRAAKRLENAAYIDLDYDTDSRDLVLTSFHHKSPGLEGWDEQVKRRQNSARTEVGVFASQEATEPEELSFGGYSTVIGEDEKPKPTRFSFPSRHHAVPFVSGTTFLTTFPTPTGLHPTLRLSFPSPISPPTQGCALHTYLTLPSSLFIDKYQLSSPNFLASKNLHAIHALSGETDLEAPEWVTRKWGSTLLLEIAHHTHDRTKSNTQNPTWHVDIPLHLRYLPPAPGGTTSIDVPWPIVFWACPAEEGTHLDSGNPFDRVYLGYDALFDPRTIFYHFQPLPEGKGGRLVERVHVPVMDLRASRWVESGTVGIIVLGALWVVWKLLRVSLRDSQLEENKLLQKKGQ